MSDQTTHPSPEELSAFNLGQLPPETAAAVEDHVSECETCCETLLGLGSHDTFVDLLKEARQAGDDESANPTYVTSTVPRRTDSPATVPETLTEHSRYEIVRLIGKGGMGDVFEARHRMMDRTVALKVINHEFIRKPQAVDRFHREVKAAARLSHPNIVTAYDAEQAGDQHFLVMEYVDGVDLANLVKDRGSLSVSEACDFARQAAIGLQHAHDQGMVHRDIKPHNLMVTADGTVKILDFGLASLAPEVLPEEEAGELPGELTAAGAIIGTPDFISPEQAQDAHQADIRSDIYSLGATLYYLLSGRAPFADASVIEKLKSHAEQEPVPLENLQIEIPDELADVIRKMMAKDPAERYQTPQEVADALVPFVDQHRTVPADRTPAASEFRDAGRRWAWVIAGLAAAFIALAGIIYIETDKGTLVIDAPDDSVAVRIFRVNEESRQPNLKVKITLIDQVTGSQVVRLRSGTYKVSLADEHSTFQLNQDGFTLSRGSKVVLKVTESDSGERAIAGGPEKRVTGLSDLRLQGTFEGHEGHVYHAIISPDGKYAVSCGADKTIRVWDIETQEEIRMLTGHEGAIAGLAVSATGRLLASGDNTGMIRLWNLQTGASLGSLAGHEGFATDLAFLPDGRLLSAGFDETLRIWDVNEQKLLRTIELGAKVEKMEPLWDNRRVMLSGAHTGGWGVVTYDLEKGEKLDPQASAQSCLAVADDRKTTLIGTITGMLRVQNMESGRLLVQMADPRAKAARDAAILPGGRFAITTTRDGQMHLWNLEEGDRISSVTSDSIGTVTLSPNGRYALTIGREGGVAVWRLPDSVLPNPIRSQPAATPETRRQFEEMIAAARTAETEEDWKLVLAGHAPMLLTLSHQRLFPQNAGPGLVQMLAELPDAMHETLLQQGYLRWRAADLDQHRQKALLDVLGALRQNAPNPPEQGTSTEDLQALLKVSDVGFIVLDLPALESQTVACYLRYDNFPMPTLMMLSGGTAQAVQESFKPEVRQQVEDLKQKPYTDLPPVPVASPEIRSALLALRENFPSGNVSEEQRIEFLSEYSPFLADTRGPGNTAYDLVTLLHSLPQNSIDSLLMEGFVKWPYSKLDKNRQETIRRIMTGILSAVPEQHRDEKVIDLLVTSLVTADVGFVVLSLPDHDEQFITFFLQTSVSFNPTLLPVLGNVKDDFLEINSPEVRQQIKDILKQPDSPLPPAIVEKADPVSLETRRQFEQLIAALESAASDEDWNQLIAERTPVLEEFPETTARELLQLVAGLPQTTREALLNDGYLKWKFQDLDAARKLTMKNIFGEILSLAPPGIEKELVEDLKSVLDNSVTGFAVLNLSESSEQIVIWYAMTPEAPVPTLVPFLGVSKQSETKVFKRSVFRQLAELEDKPYSTLPSPQFEEQDLSAFDPAADYPTLAPFDALRWEDSRLHARVQGTWYELQEIDGVPVERILAACRRIDEDIWLERFAEDLVQVMSLMGHPPGRSVNLKVHSSETGESILLEAVPMTDENRDALRKANLSTTNHALQFNGDSTAVSLPIRYDGSHPITLECTVLLEDHGEVGRMLISDTHDAGINLQISPNDQRLLFSPRSERQAQPIAWSRDKFPFGKKVHVAGVYTGQEVRLYLNGKLQQTVPVPGDFRFEPSPMKLAVGANPDGPASFRQSPIGLIDEVRISKVARYKEDFTPAARFEPDDDTLALYHFDEGIGTTARDSSGNKLDGEIFGAKWLKWPSVDLGSSNQRPSDEIIELGRFSGHTGPVKWITVSPDGRYVASASGFPDGDKSVRVWDLSSRKLVRVFAEEDMDQMLRAQITRDSKHLWACGADGQARLWEIESGRELCRIHGTGGRMRGLELTPDGKHVVVACGGRWQPRVIAVHDAETGERIRTLNSSTESAFPLAFDLSPDGKLVLCRFNYKIQLFDVESGDLVKTLSSHQDNVEDAAFSHDGRRIVSGGQDDIVRVWDVATGEQIREFHGHSETVLSTVFTPDDRHVVSAGYDGSVKIWNVESAKLVTQTDLSLSIWSAVITPDGKYILCGGGSLRDAAESSIAESDFELRILQMPDALRPRPLSSRQTQSETQMVDSRVLLEEFRRFYTEQAPEERSEIEKKSDPFVVAMGIATMRVHSPDFLRVTRRREAVFARGEFDDAAARKRIESVLPKLRELKVELPVMTRRIVTQYEAQPLSGARLELAAHLIQAAYERVRPQNETSDSTIIIIAEPKHSRPFNWKVGDAVTVGVRCVSEGKTRVIGVACDVKLVAAKDFDNRVQMALRSTPDAIQRIREAAKTSEYWFEIMPFQEAHRQTFKNEVDLSDFLKQHSDYRPAGPDDWGWGAPDGRLKPPAGEELPNRK